MIERKKRGVFAYLAVSILFVLSGLAWAEPAEPYKTRLDNGLTVIVEEEHSAPVVSIQAWVKVGSADEIEKRAGISHVFEHMLFKGTEKRKVGEIASMIESVGGDINAYTSFENTVYHATVPSRYFSTGLDALSDAIQNSTFDKDELQKELEVVLEEIRMNEDNPARNLYKTLLGTAYTKHPYKRPVIGFTETVKTFTRDDMLETFRKWYIPNNIVLVISGDVKKDEAVREVKKAFAGFKKSPDPHKARPVEPPQKAVRAEVVAKPIKEAHLGMGFHVPALKDEDIFALDVLQLILGGGESSRLYKELKLEKSLVHSITSYTMPLKDPGMFFITAVLEPKNVDATLKETIKEIKKLQYGGPSMEELERAKFNLESDFIFSRETTDGIAGKLGYYEVNLGDMNYDKKYIEGIRKVTAEDVRKVLEKYFDEDSVTVAAVVPKDAKDGINPAAIENTVETAAKEAKTEFATVEEVEGAVTKVKLENGITLIVKEVHTNPTVAFYGAFPGGLRFEERQKDGVGNFTASMLTRGTTKRTREELAKEVEEMAGGISGFSGWNSTGASAKFLSRFFEKGLSMYADVLKNPVFPQEEIEKLRKDVLAAIARQEDYLPGYTFKLLYKELYKTHPYGMPVIGEAGTVSALKREDLIAHYEKFFVPERMVLTIVGDVDSDYAVEKVKEAFSDFTRKGAELKEPAEEERQAGIRKTGEAKEKEQVHIGIGFLGTEIGNPDSYALKVMNEVLSGQGGRLFINLRDKQSLAYSVSAFSKEGVDPGILGVYIGTAPEKRSGAIEGIMGELKRIREAKVSEAELNRAKRSIIGSYEIGLQEVSSQASDMANNELYGLGYEFYKEFPKKIEAVTAEDVLKAAQKYLTLDAYTISIVGPGTKE